MVGEPGGRGRVVADMGLDFVWRVHGEAAGLEKIDAGSDAVPQVRVGTYCRCPSSGPPPGLRQILHQIEAVRDVVEVPRLGRWPYVAFSQAAAL